ncbi:MAG: glycosyltransferase family 39 protein [Chloroflexi bacterium]|nr:glycosyltransferase family 39 protein [Chloroflexota bacterium]
MTIATRTHKISRREWLAVIALLLIAFALRTHDLLRVPPGLHNDEVIETKTAESVAAGRLGVFFPEDTGAEGLHYYYAALFLRVFGNGVYALRLPAVFLGLISLCLIWALGRRLFGPVVAITAMAGYAGVFWPVVFGRIVSHTIMLVPVATLAAYSFWRARAAAGRRVTAWLILSGLWLGLSFYAYTAARILPVIFIAFGVYSGLAHRRSWRAWLRPLALTLAVALIIALPLAVYLGQNPAVDDLGFFDIDRPLRELQQGNLSPVVETSLRTLGMFAFVGDPLPYYDVPDRPVLEPCGALLLLIGLLVTVRRWRQPEYAVVCLWFFISLLPGMLSQPAPNYTRTLGVQTVLFSAIGLGVKAVLDRVRGPIMLGALALVFVGNLVWTTHDYFTIWPSIPTVRFWHHSGLYAVANDVQASAESSAVAICLPDYLIDERVPWWKPGYQHLRYLLHRNDVSVRYYNCAETLVLPAGPARYAFPDAVEEAALQQFPIYTRFLASAPADRTTLPDQLGVILKIDRAATPLDQQLAMAGQNKVFFEGDAEAVQRPIDLGGKLKFAGYMLSRAGKAVELMTYWRVSDQLPPQVSQFTHVLNAPGEIVTQADRWMVTSQSLQAGDVVAQIHRLTLPGNLSAGSYRIAIGLYTQPDGKRLPVIDNGQPRGDRLFLESIEIR